MICNTARAALLALMCIAGAGPLAAENLIYEVKAGALYHDAPNLWSGFRAEKESLDVNVDVQLSPAISAFFGTIRPAVGASINTAGQTSMGYVDARYTYDAPSGVFYAIGLGAAIHDGQLHLTDYDRKALGSRVLFHIPLEVGYYFDAHTSLSAYFEHMSNGYTQRTNEGMDRLGVRYGYRF